MTDSHHQVKAYLAWKERRELQRELDAAEKQGIRNVWFRGVMYWMPKNGGWEINEATPTQQNGEMK